LAVFFTAAFFTGALFLAVFFAVLVLLAAALSYWALAALTASHRFFVAAMIAFLPAAESFRLGLGAAAGAGGSVAFLEAAHLLRWASPMRFRAAAPIFRRLRVAGSGAAAGSVGPPVSQARSSAILASSFSFWASIPKIAAFTISVVSFGVGM
jgi:hypothetical protein